MTKREEILQIALKAFSTYGYDSVGIQKIVDTAQVKKPTLYYYFGSKRGVLEALLDHYYTPFLTGLESVTAYSGDVVHTLEGVAKHYFSFAQEYREVYLFMLSIQFSPSESEVFNVAKSYLNKTHEILVNMFLSFEQDHGNMKGRSVNYATSFRGILASYITSFFSGQTELDDQKVYEVCRQFMYGIFS